MEAEPGSERAERLAQVGLLFWNVGVFAVQTGDRGPLERLTAALDRDLSPSGLGVVFARWRDDQRRIAPADNRIAIRATWIRDSAVDKRFEVEHVRYGDFDAAKAREFLEAHVRVMVESAAQAEAISRDHVPATTGLKRGMRSARNPKVARVAPVPGDGDPVDPVHAAYAEAIALGKDAPWEWMGSSFVFGLRVPGDSAIYWCSVMGAGGEFEGMALYRGDRGFEALYDLFNQRNPDEAVYGRDGLLVAFSRFDEVDADEVERIRSSGLRPRKNGPWPQLQEMREGRLPRVLPPEHAARMTTYLRAGRQAAHKMRHLLEACGPEPGRLQPVFTLQDDVLTFSMQAPLAVPAPLFPAVDKVAVTKLLRTAKRVPSAMEFDGIPMPMRVADEDGWEYVPTVFLLADPARGRLLPPTLERPETRYATCAKSLLGILQNARILPKQLLVGRDWVFDALLPTARALGMQLHRVEELPQLAHAREEFEAHHRKL